MTVVLLVTCAFWGTIQPAEQVFQEGCKAFNEGRFEEALEKYMLLNNAYGINSAVMVYNIGVVNHKLGRLGPAIFYYESALSADPSLEAARKNLQIALGQTKRSLPIPEVRQVNSNVVLRYYPISPRASLYLTHVGLVGAIGLFLLYQWRQSPKWVWSMRVLVLAALVFYLGAWVSNATLKSAPKLAIVQNSEVPVFFSMNESEQPRFFLYEGDRVWVDRMENDWARIYVYGGERGWTREEHLGILDYRIW